jgi:probable F420-dependent oxidoreductase
VINETGGIGLHYGATDESMPLLELARAAEDRGFESVFLPEHSHVPVARTTPYPGGGDIPRRYLRLWDPLTALAMVAATTDLTVGTCVALLAEHDAIAYAKAVATLDVMSGGRLVLGVGFGWNDDEAEGHGFAAKDKHAVMLEKLQLMQRIWTDDEAGFEGEHVHMTPSWSWPKPLQRPHPPVLLGGLATTKTFGRVAAHADGWIPMSMAPAATLASDLARLRERWVAAGRAGAPRVVVMQAVRPTAELVDLFDTYRDLGVERVLVDIPTEPASVLLPMLDQAAAAIAASSR